MTPGVYSQEAGCRATIECAGLKAAYATGRNISHISAIARGVLRNALVGEIASVHMIVH